MVLPSALANVVAGQPHVAAHNDERSAINALLTDHVGVADLSAAVATSVESAIETYAPGATAGYAKVTTTLTSTAAAYPGTSLAGLTFTVVGNGRPLEVVLVLPSVAHSVAGTTVTFEVTVNAASLGANNMLAQISLPSGAAGKASSLTLSREIPTVNGASMTFVVNGYASAAGTITLVGGAYVPLELKAIRR